ncbi:MAG: hypothetical protein V4582_14115 [Pseudomonadota bacterium]
MTRRAIVHVLLSLLLLVSQQMALSHAMAHWSARQSGAQLSQGSQLGKALAQDQACEQCLAFAQLAGAVGSPARSFACDTNPSLKIAACAPESERRRTVCAFRSRAPPVLA